MKDPTSQTPTIALVVTIKETNADYRRPADPVRLQIAARPVYLAPAASDQDFNFPMSWTSAPDPLAELYQETRTTSDDPPGWVSTEVVYHRDTVNLYAIRPMAAELARIDRAWSKRWETDGSADTVGEFVLRFARIMRATTIFLRSDTARLSLTGREYEPFTLAEGKWTINHRIQCLFHSAPAPAAV